MLSDKEGCFVVAYCTEYQRRVQETMEKNFKEDAVSLGQQSKKVDKYCHNVRLSHLPKSTGTSKQLSLSVSFSKKTHKDAVLFGAIAPERQLATRCGRLSAKKP